MTNDESILNLYMKDINRIPLLTRDEEIELSKKAQAGDKAAKDKLVQANLRFVINVAKKYQNHGIDLVDLISEGNIGLLTAVDHFDISKGYHFISYAVWWIRQSILKAICEKSRAIRLPLNRANEIVQIEKVKKMLRGRMSESEEIEEIGKMLNMDPSHVRDMMNISREMASLDTPVASKDSESGATMGDFLEDTGFKPEEYAINESMKEDIASVLKTLRPNEAKVLRLRYGLDDGKTMSLKEVGDACKLTKERIRQIEKHALVRMQHPYRLARLEAYVA
ncbi:MAG: RNA polymerase sigma factor RpoD/SigA [Treponema sp.]|nr:sigma-70 family RNA polymerase sigma factor [Treponema sp.]MCR5620964.1 RNA polymerase sigma factor RpoD/SigA [Treponema sp.]